MADREASALANAIERRDLDMEEQQLIEDAWDNEPLTDWVDDDDVEDEL